MVIVMNPLLPIEVSYAKAEQQYLIPLKIATDCDVQTAIQLSGILTLCPEIDLQKNAVGIFGKQVSLTTLLQTGDRIEIYRPLLHDPNQARLRRQKRGT